MPLTRLPPEILHHILALVDPADLSTVSQTCRFFNDYITGNNPLCREVYLYTLDTPQTHPLDFHRELVDLTRLRSLCSPPPPSASSFEFAAAPVRPIASYQARVGFVDETVTRLLANAVTAPNPMPVVPTPPYPKAELKPYGAAGGSGSVGNVEEEEEESDEDEDEVEEGKEGEEEGEEDVDEEKMRRRKEREMLANGRPSRAVTYPMWSRNREMLEGLFDGERVKEGLLWGSFLFERARVMAAAMERGVLRGMRGGEGVEEDSEMEEVEEEEVGERGGRAGGDRDSSEAEEYLRPRQRQVKTLKTALRKAMTHQRPPGREKLEQYQASAHLHCLYGPSLTSAIPPGHQAPPLWWNGRPAARLGGALYALACAKVYDLREYTRGTRWGPFLDETDGDENKPLSPPKVDWEKMEAIMIVLGTNLRKNHLDEHWAMLRNLWAKPFAGVWSNSYIPWRQGKQRVRESALERADPYGVSGTWLRTVCFLDYRDFFAFNFPLGDQLPNAVPRPPLSAGEALRLILLRLRVTKIEPPGEGDHPDWPVVHFRGFSRALDEGSWNNEVDTEVRGTVRTTPEGEVWWSSVTTIEEEERWRSEGVQLGGVRSARGVVGTWFDKDYSENGPCGPSTFWKVSDHKWNRRNPQAGLMDLLPILGEDGDLDENDPGNFGMSLQDLLDQEDTDVDFDLDVQWNAEPFDFDSFLEVDFDSLLEVGTEEEQRYEGGHDDDEQLLVWYSGLL